MDSHRRTANASISETAHGHPSFPDLPSDPDSSHELWIRIYMNTSRTFLNQLPIFQVDLNCALHRVATLCRGNVDELATEPFLLLHREHGTGYRRNWNCCDRRTRFIVIWKHFCFILSTGTRIRIDSVMCPRSSSRGCNTSVSVTVTSWIAVGGMCPPRSCDATMSLLYAKHVSVCNDTKHCGQNHWSLVTETNVCSCPVSSSDPFIYVSTAREPK